MKTKVIFKTLLDIMLFISAGILLDALIRFLGVHISSFPSFPKLRESLEKNPIRVQILVSINLGSQVLFFCSVLYLHKLAKVYRIQKSIYQIKILRYLSVSGWCLLIFSVMEIIIRILEFSIAIRSIQLGGLTSGQKSLFLAILAILMIRLAKIFKKTVEEKREHEFTI